ncbi:TetR/AcrR family transcriptional regulator [Nonomuraea basaltis]|uniref:TetR/AcrR family transcriptional regulator n=1 Tax=Nonomuraea basaltis TaxID=2495887 RepID=UPI00110C50CB|nr:TetR/AcrR family transcriptional regulator [Nonomuraea basaltis]TMR94775.1 TetR/AcrR family transcriptional regulator [Nonomuraea basaltis]
MPMPRSAYEPRKTPRQQRAWQTRERILAASAHIFAEYGYASGTTDRIAEEAGLSIGSLYQYFPNKDAILLILARTHLDETAQAVRQALAEPRPLDQWLPALTEAVVELHAGNPRLHQVLFEEAPRPPDLRGLFRRLEHEAVIAVEELLRGDPGLEASQVAVRARFVIATIESLTHRFIGRASEVDADGLAKEISTIVTKYLR